MWAAANLRPDKTLEFYVDSDSDITRGWAAVLARTFSGLTPEAFLQVPSTWLDELAHVLGPAISQPSRTNGFLNLWQTMRKRVLAATEDLPKFPSLLITRDALVPMGSYAEAQSQYLDPPASDVASMAELLRSK